MNSTENFFRKQVGSVWGTGRAHYLGEQWLFSPGWILSLRIKLFLLFFIAFRQRSCPCPWSFLGRRLAVLKKITRIAEGCPHNKEKYWRGQGRADNDTRVLLFHWLHKFLPVLEFCRCGRWKGRFANWEWFLSHCVLVIYLHFLLVILLRGASRWYIYL